MAFCLPKEYANNFLHALQSGKIDPAELVDMTSEERRAFFDKIVGTDHGADVNALFESKLLLKDYKRGLVTWAKKIAGLSDIRPFIPHVCAMRRPSSATTKTAWRTM